MSSPLYGLVLVGGKSKRMGREKALLTYDGEQTQLERMICLLDEVSDQAFVSLREGQKLTLPDGATPVFDELNGIKGPLCGILSAMKAYPLGDWLVVACDLPNVKAPTLTKLIAAYRSEAPQLTAYKNAHTGSPEPLCAIYPSGSDAELIRKTVELDTYSPRKIMGTVGARLLEQAAPNSLENVNTAAEYAAALQNK